MGESDQNESYIQVATDGSGKKVRNLALEILQPDKTIATVYVQCVAIVDSAGRAVDFTESTDLLRQLLQEMRALRRAVGECVGDEDALVDTDDDTL